MSRRIASAAPLLLALAIAGCASGGPNAGSRAEAGAERAATIVEANDGHVLVVLRERLDRPTAQIVGRLARDHRLSPRASWPMKSLGRQCVVFDVLGGRVDRTLLSRLEDDPAVEMAQVNSTFRLRSIARRSNAQPPVSGDPHADLQTSRRLLRLDAAHRVSTGKGVRVGIVDTGADLDHPDLRGRVVEAKRFVQDDETFTTDRHGTAVAGVIGAARGNGVGIVGVAPDALLHVLKACWYPQRRSRSRERGGPDGPAVCSSYSLALALDHAVDAGYDVVNLSLGGPADPLLELIVESGIDREMVFVAPAPAADDPEDAFLAGTEGVVRAMPIVGWIEGEHEGALVAPGTEVLTTVPGGGYDFVDGSSLAAAHVAGVVALLLENRSPPSPRFRIVTELLQRTSHEHENLGAPVIDACAALAARDAGLPAEGSDLSTLACGSRSSSRGPPTSRESRRPRSQRHHPND